MWGRALPPRGEKEIVVNNNATRPSSRRLAPRALTVVAEGPFRPLRLLAILALLGAWLGAAAIARADEPAPAGDPSATTPEAAPAPAPQPLPAPAPTETPAIAKTAAPP